MADGPPPPNYVTLSGLNVYYATTKQWGYANVAAGPVTVGSGYFPAPGFTTTTLDAGEPPVGPLMKESYSHQMPPFADINIAIVRTPSWSKILDTILALVTMLVAMGVAAGAAVIALTAAAADVLAAWGTGETAFTAALSGIFAMRIAPIIPPGTSPEQAVYEFNDIIIKLYQAYMYPSYRVGYLDCPNWGQFLLSMPGHSDDQLWRLGAVIPPGQTAPSKYTLDRIDSDGSVHSVTASNVIINK